MVQETYARAFRSWRSFTPGTNMRAWMLRILTNLNVDRGRRVQRSPQLQPLEERLLPGEQARLDRRRGGARAGAGRREVVAGLGRQCARKISPQFREVVVLVDIGDFTYADAAQILDVPIGTIMSRLHRGRRALKQKLAEEALT